MGVPRLCCKTSIPSNILTNISFYKATLQQGNNPVHNKISYTLLKNNCKAFVQNFASVDTKNTMFSKAQNTKQIAKDIILQHHAFTDVYNFLVENADCLYVKIYKELYVFLEFQTINEITIRKKLYETPLSTPFYQLGLALKEYDFKG